MKGLIVSSQKLTTDNFNNYSNDLEQLLELLNKGVDRILKELIKNDNTYTDTERGKIIKIINDYKVKLKEIE